MADEPEAAMDSKLTLPDLMDAVEEDEDSLSDSPVQPSAYRFLVICSPVRIAFLSSICPLSRAGRSFYALFIQ